MTLAPDPKAALSRALSEDRGRIIAALIARVHDIDMAEEALQEAASSALVHWQRSGVPDRPLAWLIRVAFRKAIDRLRRTARDARHAAQMALLARDEAEEPEMIADERLRLIFTCCHPALEQKSQVALTLRTICGLSTSEIARAFLDQEATMGQRLSRAKAKIIAAHIPFCIPGPEDWSERLGAVLQVIYLIFNAGYSAGSAQRDLACEAIFLGQMLNELCPAEAEVEGALALMLLTHARQAARVGPDGASLPPGEQDRTLWDHRLIAQGLDLVGRALARNAPGPYQIKASLAACHLSGHPDWEKILVLYQALVVFEPTPVIQLNLAVALAENQRTDEASALLRDLASALKDYQPFYAALADVCRRRGDATGAIDAYDRAIHLASRPEDAAFLYKRREAVRRAVKGPRAL